MNSVNHTAVRVNWVTHLPAPYRIRLWRYISRFTDLRIQCTEPDHRIGRPGSRNRGDDWKSSNYGDLNFEVFRAIRLSWRDVPLYVLLPFGRVRSLRLADVVLIGGWEVPAYWQVLILAKLLKKRTVGFYESPANTNKFRKGPVARARSFFFRHLDETIVPGEAAAEALRLMGVPPSRIRVGFNAVDVEHFHERSATARAKLSTEESDAGHRFLYVGQLIARKRVLQLLDAFLRIAAPSDTLTLIGSGELKDELERRVNAHGASGVVRLFPHVNNEELPEYYARADTLCLVSEEEVWGLVVNEALASGLQVVVSANCGVAPSVQSMEGVTVVSEDLDDLCEGMNIARSSFRGPIIDPEVMRHTPEAFGNTFLDAFGA